MNDVVYTTLMGAKKTPDSPFVFCNKKGRSYRVDADTDFRLALKKAGIEDFRFHDLRHVFASQLIMMGSNLSVVQKLLGYKTLQMTQRYAHLSPSVERDTLDKFSNWMDTIWTPSKITGNLEKEQKTGEASGTRRLVSGPSRDRRREVFVIASVFGEAISFLKVGIAASPDFALFDPAVQVGLQVGPAGIGAVRLPLRLRSAIRWQRYLFVASPDFALFDPAVQVGLQVGPAGIEPATNGL